MAIVGCQSSQIALAVADIAKANKIPFVSSMAWHELSSNAAHAFTCCVQPQIAVAPTIASKTLEDQHFVFRLQPVDVAEASNLHQLLRTAQPFMQAQGLVSSSPSIFVVYTSDLVSVTLAEEFISVTSKSASFDIGGVIQVRQACC